MKRYDSMDLISDLQKLVDKNVKYYKSDFDIDKKAFYDSLQKKEQDFIWLTRECGTGIAREKDVYMDGTYAHIEIPTFLLDRTVDAYFVHVDGVFDDKLIGSYYPVNEKTLLEEIEKYTVPVHEVKVIPKEEESFCVPYQTYERNGYFYAQKYGEFTKEYLLDGEGAEIVAGALLKNKRARDAARCVNTTNENRIFQYDTSYGETEDVMVDLNMYQDNDNLYVGLNYYDKEEGAWDSYGNLTVNVIALPYLHTTLDTNNNNAEHLINFLEGNGFGRLTGEMVASGFCQFPVFKFSEEKLKEICSEEFFEYQKAHGKAKSLDKQLNDAKEIKENLDFTRDSGQSRLMIER